MPGEYLVPPIIEVVCEFRFETDADWDLTYPGRIYERLGDLFPTPKTRRQFQERDAPQPEGLLKELKFTEISQLWNKQETAFAQIGPGLLSVNHLAPYPSWKHYRPYIWKAYEQYLEVVKPVALSRIGLRYINRIPIPALNIQLEDYFRMLPGIAPDLPQTVDGFLVVTEFAYHDMRDKLRVRFGTKDPELPQTFEFILDLDYFLASAHSVDLVSSKEWVEGAHDQIEMAFEACLTDRTRDFFNRADSQC